ncbi:MAG: polyamine aminopropyltransferase [Bacillota bacterium]|jgi:spermidine synthase
MEVWFTEKQTPNLAISCRVTRVLCSEQTPFQKLAVVDTAEFGRMLLLDNVIQTTVRDEFVYHEMITHVGLNTHPNPRQVLVIGGGDGGSIREAVKHPTVEKARLVEIDGRVIEAAKEFLPELSCGYADPRVEVMVDDGIKHVKEHNDLYDMIIVDSTDPVGPAEGLFNEAFYKNVYSALREDGLFVAQTESPFFNRKLITDIHQVLRGIFPVVRLFMAYIPTYPGGLWTFTMGSKNYDPVRADLEQVIDLNTRYYSPAVHRSSFVLPPFVEELVK